MRRAVVIGIDLSGSSPTDPSQPKGILQQIEDGLKNIGGVAESFAEGLNGIVGMIANALFPSQPGSKAPLVRLNDGMTALTNQVDLLNDVSGYAGMFMSVNRTFGVSPNTYRKVPLDRKYGPEKNALCDTTNSRITMAAGTWSVSVLLAKKASTGWNRPSIRIYRPNGTLFLEQFLDWSPQGDPSSFFAQITIILDTPGHYAELWYAADLVRPSLWGGTDRTKMWVNRWNISTDNSAIIINPPDGSDVT